MVQLQQRLDLQTITVKVQVKPAPNAQDDHTTFKRNPKTGEVTNYKTWKTNPENPSGFDEKIGYDGIGKSHTNPITGEKLMPPCA